MRLFGNACYILGIVIALGLVTILTTAKPVNDAHGALPCNSSSSRDDPCRPILTVDLNQCKVMTYKSAVWTSGQTAKLRASYERNDAGQLSAICVKPRKVTYPDGTEVIEDICQPEVKLTVISSCTPQG